MKRNLDNLSTKEVMEHLESEKSFQQKVIDYARLRGWMVAHFRPAQTAKGWRTPVSADGAGFPDLALVRRGILIVAELKSETGKLSKHQEDWMVEFLRASAYSQQLWYYVWKPSDWESIERILD